MTKFDPFWEKIGRISLKIVTSVKFHLIVLRPIGRDITPQAKIVRRMTMCIGLLKGFCYLSIVPRDYDICNYYYRVQHVVINMDKINVINNYTKTGEMKTQSITKDHGFGILVQN
jgi:hypothetical protein